MRHGQGSTGYDTSCDTTPRGMIWPAWTAERIQHRMGHGRTEIVCEPSQALWPALGSPADAVRVLGRVQYWTASLRLGPLAGIVEGCAHPQGCEGSDALSRYTTPRKFLGGGKNEKIPATSVRAFWGERSVGPSLCVCFKRSQMFTDVARTRPQIPMQQRA